LSDADSSNFRFRADLAASRQCIGELALATGDYRTALAFAEAASDIRDEIVRLSPHDQTARRQQSNNLTLIDTICRKVANAEACNVEWRPIVDRRERYALSLLPESKENPENCWPQLVGALTKPGKDAR
jgi:hypothetical protein